MSGYYLNTSDSSQNTQGYNVGLVSVLDGAEIESKNLLKIIDNSSNNFAHKHGLYLNSNSKMVADDVSIEINNPVNGSSHNIGIALTDTSQFLANGNLNISLDGSKGGNTYAIRNNSNQDFIVLGNVDIDVKGSIQNGHGIAGGTTILQGDKNIIRISDKNSQGLGWGYGVNSKLKIDPTNGFNKTIIDVNTQDINDEWQIHGLAGSLETSGQTSIDINVDSSASTIGDNHINEYVKGVFGATVTDLNLSDESELNIKVKGPAIKSNGFHGTVGLTNKDTLLEVEKGTINIEVLSPNGIGLRGVHNSVLGFSNNLNINAKDGYAIAGLTELQVNQTAKGELLININPSDDHKVQLVGDIAIFTENLLPNRDKKATINLVLNTDSFLDGGIGNVNTNGQLSAMTDETSINLELKDTGLWNVNKNSYLDTLVNAGHIKYDFQDSNYKIINVQKNYHGGNGKIVINTELNDDSSATDKLIITGTATGSTQIVVNNIHGTGAQTENGIHIVQTGSSVDNAFYIANGGFVSAGAFDYGLNLKKAGTGTNTTSFDNWYLESHLRNTNITNYTPDMGSYLAVETMSNTLFTSRLEDREGASQYQNLGAKNNVGNVWVRAYGKHNQFKSMDDNLTTKGDSFATQIGASLVTLGEEDQYNLGMMGGFATYDGETRSDLTGRESKTKIDGYSVGLYGTWYAHPVEKRGAYIDSWVLWNKFDNKIDTPDQNQYKYDSAGITASIEAGGDYLINKNSQKNWWIQPQVQLIYQGVHGDDFRDTQGVDIDHGKDNVQARMGVKTSINIPTNGNKLTSYRPYVALNFIHNTNPYSVVIDDVRYENEGSENLGEFKFGIEGNVTKNSQVWLNASYVVGSHDNEAYQGNIGWKYKF